MSKSFRISLAAVFWSSVLALVALVVALFITLERAARLAVDDRTRTHAEDTAARARDSIAAELDSIERTVSTFAVAVSATLADPDDPDEIAAELLRPMMRDDRIAEAGFTWSGNRDDANTGGQVTVHRGVDGHVRTRVLEPAVRADAMRERKSDGAGDHLLSPWETVPGRVEDPTDHPTFTTPASRPGHTFWSELSYLQSNMDDASARRVGVSVQRGLDLGDGRVGVVRMFVATDTLDDIIRSASRAPVLAFLADPSGRLLVSPSGSSPLISDGGDLRVDPAATPEAITAAHTAPGVGVRTIDDSLAVLLALDHPHGWRLGVVADLEHFRGGLGERLRASTRLAVGVMLAVVLGGVVTLRLLRSNLTNIAARTGAMESFDLAPSPTGSPITDVRDVLVSLEGAKAAMRAMGRYVPVELIKRIYAERREPVLGASPVRVTIMFTDIADFTSWTESTPPDALALALGDYFETVAGAVQRSGGIVDKYIGDAVMALWNVPDERPGHAAAACGAALEIARTTAALFASDAWRGEPLTTRIGIHTAEVLVGHFGAPDRLDYTAIGDGVNAAARLESLNKTYGTTIIASGDTITDAGREVDRRLLDRVIVKGKSEALEVWELLDPGHDAATVECYARALDEYRAGDVAAALRLFETHPDDPPARVLAARCRALVADGVPDDWDGVWRAKSK